MTLFHRSRLFCLVLASLLLPVGTAVAQETADEFTSPDNPALPFGFGFHYRFGSR